MKIYSMTATFGKLEHETLTLQPGLNIIEAPNEWGKSTWCAFLIAMLYGIETRVHSTKTALADKERYTPWSGAPMSGRIDLNWDGRDITIERRTKGRSVFGDFKAYETASGIAVPELTAANCGVQLLGVEKTVFVRSAFLRLTDLPVTQDESLRRRLNALVTTGDESGAGDQLAQKLRDLKNKVRFNRSGLLPQAETQRAELSHRLRELNALQQQSQQIQMRQQALETQIAQLENHQTALAYQQSQEDRRQVAKAQADKDVAQRHLTEAEALCQPLPDAGQAAATLTALQNCSHQANLLVQEEAALPAPPVPPAAPSGFDSVAPEQAPMQADTDAKAYAACCGWMPYFAFILIGIVSVIGAAVLWFLTEPLHTVPFFLSLLAALLFGLLRRRTLKGKQAALEEKYGSSDPSLWIASAKQYLLSHTAYQSACAAHAASLTQLEARQAALIEQTESLTGGLTTEDAMEHWQQILDAHASLSDARKEYQRTLSLLAVAQAMAKDAPEPSMPDSLTLSAGETSRLLNDCLYEQRQLHMRLGQCQGQMEALGDAAALQQQLTAVEARIRKLEDTYNALSIAQQTLTAATAELQRRFAPKIQQRSQELFSQLTGGRYDRLTLSDDLSLSAAAQDEDTLHASLWRSDGTVDQLYLALRLSVAEALIPEAPMILDDALVRFDDRRLASAMEVLRQEAQSRQILLFTCQGREKQV